MITTNNHLQWRVAKATLVAFVVFACTACSSIEPWVKPYERDRLADPIMFLDHDPVSTSYMNHVFESREGSRGAEGSVGGGCGCN